MTEDELAEVIDEGQRWLRYLEPDNDLVTTFIADAVIALRKCRCAVRVEADTT
jgi:hypothetical protein